MIPIVLTIAGSDSCGGAGIQADIKTVSALGGYAASVITAVTAQNTLGVQAVYPMSAEAVTAQLEAVLSDLHPQAIKIGMLPHAGVIHAIAQTLPHYEIPFIVCDPVMISTSGRRLMDKDAVETLENELFPQCSLLTPNLHEASFLSHADLHTPQEMEVQAQALSNQYQTAVLIKGGHLKGNSMCDILYDHSTGQYHQFTSEKIDSRNLHGTGCTLSSAIATYRAAGHTLPEAIQLAKRYMNSAIEQGKELHIGQGNGPLWHFIYKKNKNKNSL